MQHYVALNFIIWCYMLLQICFIGRSSDSSAASCFLYESNPMDKHVNYIIQSLRATQQLKIVICSKVRHTVTLRKVLICLPIPSFHLHTRNKAPIYALREKHELTRKISELS